MRVIPVVDLMGGQVVAARAGRRDAYRPIESLLTAATDVHSVVRALLGLHSFRTIYIADLDALTGKGSHMTLINELARCHPGIRFWVDQGRAFADHRLASANIVPVLGTESWDSAAEARASDTEWVLSLDFLDGRFVGAAAWLDGQADWPDDVVVMSLSHVGTGQGPDIDRLEWFRRDCPGRRIIAAGGVRDANDLRELANLGIDAALVATSLHNGALSSAVLRGFADGE
ncbi:MAG: HisA/HisF-related TIM barrel protein [Methylotetracoccus sp.]